MRYYAVPGESKRNISMNRHLTKIQIVIHDELVYFANLVLVLKTPSELFVLPPPPPMTKLKPSYVWQLNTK